jgi:ubiquinone/menaquinone biosynthesis C-methylase UbiE
MERSTRDAIDTSAGTRAGGAWGLLASGRAYELVQRMVSDPARERAFRERFLSVPDGAAVLDIGCGPGNWRSAFGDVRYWGLEPSRAYLERARRIHGDRGNFIEARASDLPGLKLPSFDLVLCAGLLHHLDDSEMGVLLASAARAMAPHGRLVAIETCIDPSMSAVARMLGRLDRGRFVRSAEAYRAAAGRAFRSVEVTLTDRQTRIPFPLAVLECRQPAVAAA